MMRRSLEMMRDPSALQNMMRNQDLAMSQIENLPGGFNALRRMYEDIQEPMMDAMAGSSANTSSSASNTTSQPSSSSSGVGGAMPNPWSSSQTNTNRPPSNLPSVSSSGGNTPPLSVNSLPWMMPSNPTNNPANGNPATATPTNAGSVGNGQQLPNMQMMSQMLNNPYIQTMMDQLLQDPNILQAMTQSNPYLQQISQSNPAAAALLQNPQIMRETMLQFQRNPNLLQHPFLAPPPMATPPPSNPQSSNPNPNPNPNQSNLDFSSLLTQFQNTSVTPPPAPTPFVNDEQRYQFPLQSLQDMGFANRDQNLRILRATNGNVNRAVERLLEEGPAAAPAEDSSPSSNENASTTD